MLNNILTTGAIILFCSFSAVAQVDDSKKKEPPVEISQNELRETKAPINPLSPAKAAFYSAILPGLGQAYNKRYWKIPLVFGAIGTGVYFYINNNTEYNRYRDAYKSRLAGYTTDEFYFDPNGEKLQTPRVTTEGLERAQKFYRKNKEMSLLVTVGLYALNIIDANVDAHLMQYNIDENLSLEPHYKLDELDATSHFGLTLNFKF